jgi:GT2 family glycosyltransferase
MLYICVPTYDEFPQVNKFLVSLESNIYHDFKVILVNANYPDKTSLLIQQFTSRIDILELRGQPSEYWGRTVNRAFRYICNIATNKDLVLLCNTDIEFVPDCIQNMIYDIDNQNIQVGALGIDDSRSIPSGTSFKSLFWDSKHYPHSHQSIDTIPDALLTSVNYLPGRCMMFPAIYISKGNFINDKVFPHYGGDIEFSYRLTKMGCNAFISTSSKYLSDSNNTGESILSSKLSISKKLSLLFHFKCQNNIRDKINIIYFTYPLYCMPFAFLSYFCKLSIVIFLSKYLDFKK